MSHCAAGADSATSNCDLSQYGVINAITRTAEDQESYDRATELETIGYKVIDLSASQWREINDAKPLVLAA